jgi:hypothetical protein
MLATPSLLLLLCFNFNKIVFLAFRLQHQPSLSTAAFSFCFPQLASSITIDIFAIFAVWLPIH